MSEETTAQLRNLLEEYRPGYSLPGGLYFSPAAYAADLAQIWSVEWIFVGAEAELPEPGDYVSLTIGDSSVLVVRNQDGALAAMHNVCRHRGARLCDETRGHLKRRIVCPYHQWLYHLDGTLAWARSMPPELSTQELSLAPVHCLSIGGLVFVCLAPEPADPQPIRDLLEPYVAPYSLASAHVGAQSDLVEHGNWKLVMENNRECYHCRSAHPELCATFPEAPLHSGGGSEEERAATQALVAAAEAAGLPSQFRAAPDNSYRAMRMALLGDASSMTRDGGPAVNRRFPGLPNQPLGDVLIYHYPSTWMHLMADHALVFRLLPTSPTTTELRTTWLVPQGAERGRDYDVDRLTEVWQATNLQDSELVARAQQGVRSPAYRPGPYSPIEEEGVIQFVEWYVNRMRDRVL